MEPSKMRFPRRQAELGGLIGFAFGAFVTVPWGALAAPGGQGLWLAYFLLPAFTLLGAWFAVVTSLSTLQSTASEHEVHPENGHHQFDAHGPVPV